MKKLAFKLRRNKQLQEPAGRITTDTLAEHREQVLAGGRKFKYPVQYARHKLVINAIIISVVALILVGALGWYLLYPAQNTSDFMYRVTKVLPVPVASVDGAPVRYSDYLMKYRSAVHYLVEKEQIDTNTPDGQRRLADIKIQAMNNAIADAYAAKLAPGLDIEVTEADLEAYLKQQRQSSDGEVSESTYNAVILDYYDWSPSEYRQAMKSKLLRQKVSFALDTNAETIAGTIQQRAAASNNDLNVVAGAINAETPNAVSFWPAALVPRDNQDGGLAAAAAKLQKGQVSAAIRTTAGDGFYFVKLIDSNETQVQYEYLLVPLTTLKNQLDAVKKDNKQSIFITLQDSNAA